MVTRHWGNDESCSRFGFWLPAAVQPEAPEDLEHYSRDTWTPFIGYVFRGSFGKIIIIKIKLTFSTSILTGKKN